jgi:hypothetical protein
VHLLDFIKRKFVTMHGHMTRCTVTCHDAQSHKRKKITFVVRHLLHLHAKRDERKLYRKCTHMLLASGFTQNPCHHHFMTYLFWKEKTAKPSIQPFFNFFLHQQAGFTGKLFITSRKPRCVTAVLTAQLKAALLFILFVKAVSTVSYHRLTRRLCTYLLPVQTITNSRRISILKHINPSLCL